MGRVMTTSIERARRIRSRTNHHRTDPPDEPRKQKQSKSSLAVEEIPIRLLPPNANDENRTSSPSTKMGTKSRRKNRFRRRSRFCPFIRRSRRLIRRSRLLELLRGSRAVERARVARRKRTRSRRKVMESQRFFPLSMSTHFTFVARTTLTRRFHADRSRTHLRRRHPDPPSLNRNRRNDPATRTRPTRISGTSPERPPRLQQSRSALRKHQPPRKSPSRNRLRNRRGVRGSLGRARRRLRYRRSWSVG